MKLYGFPPSPNTWKVRALADHAACSIQFELVDISKGAQRSPDFLALNPTGRTPVLVDGDLKLWESTAILQYVASKARSDLWPSNERTRADIMRWQSWQLQHWSRACEPMLFERVVKPIMNLGSPDETALQAAEQAFHREASVLDQHLAHQSYLVDNRLTLADFSVASYLFYAKDAAIPIEQYPNITRWFDLVAALPAWRNTAPRKH